MESVPVQQIAIKADEKSAPVMFYLPHAVVWGNVVVKQAIRVSTWLRTNAAPDLIALYSARLVLTTPPPGSQIKPMTFSEMFIRAGEVLAYHLIPPASDPLDYDPTEPNRHMDPVTAVIGNFRMDGLIRLAGQTGLAHQLDLNREVFTTLYDVSITYPTLPALGVVSVPYLLIRQAAAAFAQRPSTAEK